MESGSVLSWQEVNLTPIIHKRERLMSDWGSAFSKRQSDIDAKTQATEQARLAQEARDRATSERIKLLMVSDVLPAFRDFVAGARQAKDLVAKAEALWGNDAVPQSDEGLEPKSPRQMVIGMCSL